MWLLCLQAPLLWKDPVIYCRQLPRDWDGAQSYLGAKTSPHQKQKAGVHMAFIIWEREGRAPMQGLRAGMRSWRMTAPYLHKAENGNSYCKMSLACYVFLSHGIFREAVGGVVAAITIKFSRVFFFV